MVLEALAAMVAMVVMVLVAMVLVAMVLVVGDTVDLVIQAFMVGLVTLSEWLACMVVDFLVGMDMGVMATVKSMAAMVVEKDMARAAKTTATRDMATVGTDVPLEVLRPTTHPLLLLITLQLTPINQCRVMVLIKPTSHLRVTSL